MRSFIATTIGLTAWIVVTFFIYLGCAELNSTGSCDPQTAYDHCETGLDNYTR